jgi:hypothetical protein
MDLASLKAFLAWTTVLNYVVLLAWFGVFVAARGWLLRLHTRWFHLAPEHFDAVHYAGMAVYKIGILLLNLVPLVALAFLGR